MLVCTSDLSVDSTDNGENGDTEGDCQSFCWETKITELSPLDFNCYRMELQVNVKGYCKHDLSHLFIGLENAYVSNIYNSGKFSVEANFKDPKSGMEGFKVDNINGFGNDQDSELIISYEVCFSGQGSEDYLPDEIPVLFKAGTCTYIEEITLLQVDEQIANIVASAYPNPFMEEINISLNSSEVTEVNISIYDIRGKQIAQLYTGKLKANVKYTFPFMPGNNTNDKIFIYRIVASDQVLRGQILRQK